MTVPIKCARDGCTASESGTCLEGFPSPEGCPYTGAAAAGADATGADATLLQSADALTAEEANGLCRSAPTRVILLAGPRASGKTTIITSIYESFQEAPYGGYLFAGSKTLVGFERRCHLGRTSSGRNIATTGRTPSSGVQFLHLRVGYPSGDRPQVNVLLADVSGEIFRQVRDTDDAQGLLTFIERIDNLAIVLDGARLADPFERQLPRNDARVLLRALLESRRLHASCRINVVFAKWDKLLQADSVQGPAFVKETRTALEELAGSTSLSFFEVAARPEAPSPPFAFGLATLLREWVETPRPEPRPVLAFCDTAKARRESERYASLLGDDGALEAFNVQRY